MRPPKPIDEAAARSDACNGMTVSALMGKYQIGYGRAMRLWIDGRTRAGAAGPAQPIALPPPSLEPADPEAPASDADEAEPGEVSDDNPADFIEGGQPERLYLEEEDQRIDIWRLQVDVPYDRLDWLILNLSLDDAIAALLNLDETSKARAYQHIVQRTLNRIVEPPAPEDMNRLANRLHALAAPADAQPQPAALPL